MKKRLFVHPFIMATAMALTTTACGEDSATMSAYAPGRLPPSPFATGHNDQDVLFAQMMIPHHKQAIEMSKPAAGRAMSPEVKRLARQLMAKEEAEVNTMSAWLSAWGAPKTATDQMAGMRMPGMMSEHDMSKLKSASGAEFDRMFLTMMIKHHEGALIMAETEKSSGSHPQAKAMAGKMIAGQKAEIASMRRMLKSLK